MTRDKGENNVVIKYIKTNNILCWNVRISFKYLFNLSMQNSDRSSCTSYLSRSSGDLLVVYDQIIIILI